MPATARPFVLIPFVTACAVSEPADAPEPEPNGDAPRTTVVRSDDSFDGARPPFAVLWSFEELVGDWGDLALPLSVTNAWNAPLEAEVFAYVRVPGIDEDFETEIPLASGTFEPEEMIQLELHAESLPELTPGLPVVVRVVTRVLDPQSEGAMTMSSVPRLVEIDTDYQTVTARPRKPYQSLQDALYDASRPFFDPQYAKGPLDPQLTDGPDSQADPITMTSDVRICPEWRVSYLDNEGETFVNAAEQQRVPASWAKLVVSRPSPPFQPWIPGEQVFEEILDENGCTSLRPLEHGDYVMAVHTQFEKGDVEIDVEWDNEPGMPVLDIGWSGAPFRVYGPGDIHRLTGSDDRTTRVAAVISKALVEPDLPFPASTAPLKVFANEDCPSSNATACASESDIHIGTNNEGIDGTRFRNLVAHEVGHVIQYRGSQRFSLNLTGHYDWPLAQICSCRHIGVGPEEPSHCLQSVEQASFAFGEGFGHFVAARLFNSDPFGCEFQYYKPLWWGPTSTSPAPVLMDCELPPLWATSHGCVRAGDDVEYDWLAFFWAINHAPAAERWSVQDMFDVMSSPCVGEPPYGHCDLDWAWLEGAVNASSFSTAKKERFFGTGIVYGVTD